MNTRPRNIVLIGFMGAGKSTVGRILAGSLSMPFVDVDAHVQARAGLSIPQLFSNQGEGYFRRLEAEIVQEVVGGSGQVVATGGGAVSDPVSLAAMLDGNLVVWLTAPLPLLVERASRQGERPLLVGEGAIERSASRYATRVPFYSQACLAIRADASPTDIAGVIERYWNLARAGGVSVRDIEVRLAEQAYRVHVGVGLLEQIPLLLPPERDCRGLVVTDDEVADLYGSKVLRILRSAGWQVELTSFPAGEDYKTLDTLRQLYSAFIGAGLSRDSVVIALGGGVVGDVAGLGAATFLRGVPFVQLPTTFLAQVDASVGGKVAVNLPEGKNLVGAFYQPKAVLADIATMTSLPHRELLSGLAEVIKHGLIADPELFQFVEDHLPDILARDPEALVHCVVRSCEIKGAIVEADEKEVDRREVLNFGHTVGHAVEAISGYGQYAHGEAVAIGMVAAARLSCHVGLPKEDLDRLCNLLRRAGLPLSAPHLPVDRLLEAMQRDKKVRLGQERLVLVPRIGQAQPGIVVQRDQLRAVLSWQQQGFV